jgi:hypothetical protein
MSKRTARAGSAAAGRRNTQPDTPSASPEKRKAARDAGAGAARKRAKTRCAALPATD